MIADTVGGAVEPGMAEEGGPGHEPDEGVSGAIDRFAGEVMRVGSALTDLEPAGVETHGDHGGEPLRYERSSRAAIRLIACVLGIAAVALLSWLLPRTHEGLESDLSSRAGRWVIGIGEFGDATATVVATLTMVLAVSASLVARRPRQLVTCLVAIAASMATVIVAARIGGSTPGQLSTEEWALAVAAAGVAVGAASFSVLAMPVARWTSFTIAVFTIAGVLGSEISLAARSIALLAGGAVGAAAALVFGTATRRVAGSELSSAMELIGLPVNGLTRHGGDARGSQPWVATLSTGRSVFVKVTAVDELRSDQLYRFWRRLRLRRADDERSPTSVRRAVEHEAFVADRARAAGVRTPHVLALGPLANDRGMFAVYSSVDGLTLDHTDPSDPLLRGAWSQVQILRRARIAHRDLRAANVMSGRDGEDADQAWVIDFGFAEIAAAQDLLDRDLAELLVSTAALVGVERAVDTGVAVMGADELATAIPWVQPLAVCAASRAALSRNDFERVRERVRATAGISAPELPQLQRVSRRAVIATVALGLAILALLPQITRGIDWSTVLQAHIHWAVIAVFASTVTYVGAGISMAGSVTDSVSLRSTTMAQVASSFTNRITPAKVGGVALNVRFLTKQGIDAATATTGVAVSTAVGTVVHVLLMAVALVWSGKTSVSAVPTPSTTVIVIVVAALAATASVIGMVRPVRRWFTGSVVPSLQRSARSFLDVMRTPRNVVMLVGGSAMVTIANFVAFDTSLRAFDIAIPISSAAVVYLAGSALAAAAPTPGGLGATEAALVAGLALVGVEQRMAIPAVLLFRLATFWLPILPGWIGLTVLQRRGDV